MRYPFAVRFLRLVALVGLLLATERSPAMADFFDVFEEIIRDHKSGLDHTSRSLDVALTKSLSKSNDFFDVLTTGRSGSFPELKSAEFRVERSSGKIRMILIDVDAAAKCVPTNEVMRRFGSSPELSPPSARQPAGSPVYYVYHRPWGDLRIGMSQGAHDCVQRIVAEFAD